MLKLAYLSVLVICIACLGAHLRAESEEDNGQQGGGNSHGQQRGGNSNGQQEDDETNGHQGGDDETNGHQGGDDETNDHPGDDEMSNNSTTADLPISCLMEGFFKHLANASMNETEMEAFGHILGNLTQDLVHMVHSDQLGQSPVLYIVMEFVNASSHAQSAVAHQVVASLIEYIKSERFLWYGICEFDRVFEREINEHSAEMGENNVALLRIAFQNYKNMLNEASTEIWAKMNSADETRAVKEDIQLFNSTEAGKAKLESLLIYFSI